jgi:hypothetical protein
MLTALRYSSSYTCSEFELKLYLSGDEKSDRKEEAANDLCSPNIVQHQQAVLQLWAQQQLPANSSKYHQAICFLSYGLSNRFLSTTAASVSIVCPSAVWGPIVTSTVVPVQATSSSELGSTTAFPTQKAVSVPTTGLFKLWSVDTATACIINSFISSSRLSSYNELSYSFFG